MLYFRGKELEKRIIELERRMHVADEIGRTVERRLNVSEACIESLENVMDRLKDTITENRENKRSTEEELLNRFKCIEKDINEMRVFTNKVKNVMGVIRDDLESIS